MFNTEMKFCPGCRNGCSLDNPTCSIGEMFRAQQAKRLADSLETVRIRPGEDLTEVLKIRREIFNEGEDDLDEIAINIILSSKGTPYACGRILLDMESDRLIIEQIGVIEGMRRRGIGSAVADELIKIARECESETVWAKAHANDAAIALLGKKGFEEMNRYWMTLEL